MRRRRPYPRLALALLCGVCLIGAQKCSGSADSGHQGYTVPDQRTQALSVSDVDTILRQASHQASTLPAPATLAVVDRVGNVLAVAETTGFGVPPATATITSSLTAAGLEGTVVPSTIAAISKAITAAYLSSGGEAFSTRTLDQLFQEHFQPQSAGTASGAFFGLQFSQLPCSDFARRSMVLAGGTTGGPQRSPLGLAPDAGGLPLYKNGVLVGGLGVMSTASYSLDLDVTTITPTNDELIALAGQTNYAPAAPIQAENLALDGITLQYSDATPAELAPVFPSGGYVLANVPGFYAGAAILLGQFYGGPTGASGIVPDGSFGAALYPTVAAYVFYDPIGAAVRFPPNAGFAPAVGAITASEAQQLIAATLAVAPNTAAELRLPTNSAAQTDVAVVDLDGNILALAGTFDAPVFAADTAVQKARSAVFFSRVGGGSAFDEVGAITAPPDAPASPSNGFAYYTTTQPTALGDVTLFNSGTAFSGRALAELSRPFFPDGKDGNPNGPLSVPFGAKWSEFSTGLQLDLEKFDLLTLVTGVTTNDPTKFTPPAAGCGNATGGATAGLPRNAAPEPTVTQLANGLQIAAGAMPIYRGATLVGALAVAGDSPEVDDFLAFSGVATGPAQLTNAPTAIRASQVVLSGTQLDYAICPAEPLLGSNAISNCQ